VNIGTSMLIMEAMLHFDEVVRRHKAELAPVAMRLIADRLPALLLP